MNSYLQHKTIITATMKLIPALLLAALVGLTPLSGSAKKKAAAQAPAETTTTFSRLLWDGEAPHPKVIRPGKDGKIREPKNIGDTAKIFVSLPAPSKANGKAIVLCPGGAYGGLAMDHEGHDWAKWLNDRGVALVVLQYRLPEGQWQIPVEDVQEAIRLCRRNAGEWNIDPAKVGVGGSSAGGHLASTASTHYDNPVNADPVSCRPDFSVLFYPVISMMPEMTHRGTRSNLLGPDFEPTMEILFSNDRQVTDTTPRAWIGFSHDDSAVPTQNGLRYYEALKNHGIPASLHIYPTGGHGWGMRPDFTYHTPMLTDLEAFLNSF